MVHVHVPITPAKFYIKQVNFLSGGMRRCLSVVMACIDSPDILILDEPATRLDSASRQQVWEVIDSVKEGRRMWEEWVEHSTVMITA